MHFALLFALVLVELFTDLTCKNQEKARKKKAIFMGFLLFLFAALRAPDVGIDVPSYCQQYFVDSSLSISGILHAGAAYIQSHDPTFHIFLHLLSYISNDPQIMLIVIGGFVAFGFSYFAYHQKGNLLITYLMFICLRVFPFTLSGLRQAMAMSFIWIATVCLEQKKVVKFLIFTVLGALFHQASIIFLVAFLISKMKKHNFLIGTCTAVCVVNLLSGNRLMAFLASNLLSGRFSDYGVEALQSSFSTESTTVICIVILLLTWLFFPKLIRSSEHDESIPLMFNLSAVSVMLMVIGGGFPNMFRMGYYFIGPLFALFPQTLRAMFDKKAYLIICIAVVILLAGQYFILGPGAGTENYTFFWQD